MFISSDMSITSRDPLLLSVDRLSVGLIFVQMFINIIIINWLFAFFFAFVYKIIRETKQINAHGT